MMFSSKELNLLCKISQYKSGIQNRDRSFMHSLIIYLLSCNHRFNILLTSAQEGIDAFFNSFNSEAMLDFIFLFVDHHDDNNLFIELIQLSSFHLYLKSKIYSAQNNNKSMYSIFPVSFLELLRSPERSPV